MADTIWHVQFKHTEYTLTDEDLSVTRLRTMKQIYGQAYGTYSVFINMLAQGDVDAIACGIWIAKNVAGEPNPPRSPNEVDFNMGDLEYLPIVKPREDEARPTQAEPPTGGSAPTASTTSEGNTSST